jgi:hypothetical protein
MTRILSTVAMLALTAIFAAPASAMSTTLNTGALTFANSGSVVGTTFTNANAATSDGTLTISATGDFDEDEEWFSLLIDDTTIPPGFGELARFNMGSYSFNAFYNVGQAAINALIGGDNTVRIGFVGNDNVGNGTFSATLSYGSVPEPATMSLLGLGAVLVGGAGFRRRRKSA